MAHRSQSRARYAVRVYICVHNCTPVPTGFRDVCISDGVRGQKSRLGPRDGGPEQKKVLQGDVCPPQSWLNGAGREARERERAHGGAGMGRRESVGEDIIGCPVSNVANQENCRATNPGRELGLLGGRWDL